MTRRYVCRTQRRRQADEHESSLAEGHGAVVDAACTRNLMAPVIMRSFERLRLAVELSGRHDTDTKASA